MEKQKPSIRILEEIKQVAYDKEFAQENPKLELYEVYRDLKRDISLRYDITIIQPKMLGKEFVRTKGNCNKDGFQELYTVIEGKAIFLLQKFDNEIVQDVFAIKAQAGESIIIPPYYWVIIINPSEEEILETGNWVSNKTTNQYDELEEMKGACYFAIAQESRIKNYESGINWVKNKNYKEVPALRFESPLKDKPESLDFLRSGIRR